MEESAPVIKITALVVSYNAAAALRRCLAALEASQGREQLEIIVVDCGSVDESPTLDREFAGITMLRLERNFGATKALNIGMRTAAADYVLFLVPEVLVEPGTVMALAERLDADETAAAVCPLLVDEAGRPLAQVRRLPSHEQMRAWSLDPESVPATAADLAAEAVPLEYPGREALAVRKSFIKAFNWLDDRYGEFGADLELAFQIRRARKQVLLIPGIRATVLEHAGLRFDSAALATLAADRVNGASVFLSKHFGWAAGMRFRIGAALSALAKLQLRQLPALVTGQKIDGSQGTL